MLLQWLLPLPKEGIQDQGKVEGAGGGAVEEMVTHAGSIY